MKMIKVIHSSKEWSKFLILAYYFITFEDNDVALLNSPDAVRSLSINSFQHT